MGWSLALRNSLVGTSQNEDEKKWVLAFSLYG